MGNATSQPKLKRQWTHGPKKLAKEEGFSRYNEQELTLLDRMFQDLAKRSPEQTMSKETFLEYFGLPGILGERLFSVFDTKKNGVIEFEEFVNGLGRYNRGTMNEKIGMLFEMYDLDGQAYVTKEELSIILFSLITPTTALFFDRTQLTQGDGTDNQKGKGGLIYENDRLTHVSKMTRSTVAKLVDDAFKECDHDNTGTLSQEQFTQWVKKNPSVIDALETVFAKHIWSGFGDVADEDEMKYPALNLANNLSLDNTKRSSRLDSPGHKSPLQRATSGPRESLFFSSGMDLAALASPQAAIPEHFQNLYQQLQDQYIEDSIIEEHSAFICTKCKYKYYLSMAIEDTTDVDYTKYVLFKQQNGVNSNNDNNNQNNNNNSNNVIKLKFCPECGNKLTESRIKMDNKLDLQSAMAMTADLKLQEISHIGGSGHLYKLGSTFHAWVERYYVIKEKFLYAFKKDTDTTPSNVQFISGWFISAIDDEYIKKGYYGIELQPPHMGDKPKETNKNSNKNEDNNEKKSDEKTDIEPPTIKKLYAKSAEDRDDWVFALQQAASTIAIENHYKIGKVLGKGHFSVVHLGIDKKTSEKYAIKIVEKKRIDAREKLALRNEISIMKLVVHPCIIRMIDVYEDKKCIYMVMTLVEHGDFFARWQSRKNFKENTIRVIIWKLLDALHYLHSLGIVHRDLKPENILCTSEDDDTAILISDFGLSKFAAPHTEMTMSCGTLAYVAPEVLKQNGYGRKVDLWSLGCIMHLLIRNVLPFDGRTKEQVIERTLNKKLDLITKPIWKTISVEGKDLLNQFLQKDPQNRISLGDALKHKWFDEIRNTKEYQIHSQLSTDLVALTTAGSIPPSPAVSENGNGNGNENNNLNFNGSGNGSKRNSAKLASSDTTPAEDGDLVVIEDPNDNEK